MAVAAVPAGLGPAGIEIDPGGGFDHVANFDSNTVSQYTVGAGGGLVAMAQSAVLAGAAPVMLAVHPVGGLAWAAPGHRYGCGRGSFVR